MGGATILLIGLFLPLVSLPIVGTVNAFELKDGIGAFLTLPCIAGAIYFAGMGKQREAACAFAAAGAVLAIIFFHIQSTISDMKSSLAAQLAGNPFRGIVEGFADTFGLEWGWTIIVLGLAVGLYGALSKQASVTEQPPQDTKA